jgi:hypothetical protein
MAVPLMRSGRPKFASGDLLGGTPDELKQAFEGFDAYAGTYEIGWDQNAVTHHIDVCRFPNWEGTRQRRYYKQEGDQLLLSSPPLAALGQEWVVEVAWQRKA